MLFSTSVGQDQPFILLCFLVEIDVYIYINKKRSVDIHGAKRANFQEKALKVATFACRSGNVTNFMLRAICDSRICVVYMKN